MINTANTISDATQNNVIVQAYAGKFFAGRVDAVPKSCIDDFTHLFSLLSFRNSPYRRRSSSNHDF